MPASATASLFAHSATVADRLMDLIKRAAPEAHKAYSKTRQWPGGAPYMIVTRSDGSQRVLLRTDEGDTIAGNGRTVAEAVAALEGKLSPA